MNNTREPMGEAERNARMVCDGNLPQPERSSTRLQRLFCRWFGHVDNREWKNGTMAGETLPKEPCGRCGALVLKGWVFIGW